MDGAGYDLEPDTSPKKYSRPVRNVVFMHGSADRAACLFNAVPFGTLQ
jgi:hypothetical protein